MCVIVVATAAVTFLAQLADAVHTVGLIAGFRGARQKTALETRKYESEARLNDANAPKVDVETEILRTELEERKARCGSTQTGARGAASGRRGDVLGGTRQGIRVVRLRRQT